MDAWLVAWRTSGIATVPVFATRNPALGANISIEIEIMATDASIKAVRGSYLFRQTG
jgi:hypothetical protein